MEDVNTILGVKIRNGTDPALNEAEPTESEFLELNESMKSRLVQKVQHLEDSKFKIPLRSGEIEVAEVVQKFVGFITLAKDFVGSSLASTPQGAIAWSVACFGIQVSLWNFLWMPFIAEATKFLENPIKGQKTFLEGIEATSGIMQRFLVIENTYKVADTTSNLEKPLVELYFRIMVF